MAKLPTRPAVSAGGVVYSVKDGTLHVVVRGRIDVGMWVLPKGTPAHGEKTVEAATREVGEETGPSVEIVAPLGTIDYWFVGMPERTRYHSRPSRP